MAAETVIGNYRIIRELGVGGMGAVYVGEHKHLGRHAAIKVLLPELSGNEEVVTRFFNEAKAATAIRHPGIVQVYDFGYQDDGSAYIAMEFLEGEGLDVRLRRLRQLPVQQALRFTGQIASALAAAHERGILHRDLKPANLFIVPDQQVSGGERIKILDFGIAKVTHPEDLGAGMTRAGSVMGSPSYMAPEQCRGAGDIDHRADLYSVGCILFEMMCGRRPFDGGGNGPIAIMAAQLNDPPPIPSSLRPELTEDIDALTLHLMAKEPGQRPESAAQVGHWISALSGERVSFASASGATGAPGSTDAFATQPDLPTAPGTGSMTGQDTGRPGGRLIDQLAGQVTGRVTGTGQYGGGDTNQVGQVAVAQNTARSRLGQERIATEMVATGSSAGRRGPILIGALLLAGAGALALTQMGGGPKPAPRITATEQIAQPVEPAVAEPAPAPPAPRLSFLSIEEQSERRARRQAAAGTQAAAAGTVTNMISLRLPSFSLGSLFSGSLLSGVFSSLSLIWEPEPVIVTWRIATEPPGAEVIRDGEVVGTTAQPLLIELEETPEFVTSFTLRLDRYEEASIELHGDQSYEEVVSLTPKIFATVVSRPAGAQVVDAQGTSLGTTPLELELQRGEDGSVQPRTLSLALDRHEDATVELAGAGSFKEQVMLVPKVYATVQSRPDGAEIFDEGGQSLGTAPVELELERGEDGTVIPKTVRLALDRYEDEIVELAGKRSFEKRVKLEPKIYATVESEPAGAAVFDAEGTSLGTAPVTFELPRDAQPARVVLKLDEYQDAEVSLRGRRSFSKNVKLRPRPRLTISSEPAGAEVLDASGVSLGSAPVEVVLSGTGEPLAFTLRHEGYHEERIEVASKRDKKIAVRMDPELGAVTVRIESEPAGAEVWKKGTLVGRTPVEDRFEGTPDRVKYTLKLDGYAHRTIRVAGSSDSSEKVDLRKCEHRRSGQLGIVQVYGGC